jgi:16S rRNA (adenine1518-N6/adenine1519-N6)-dimethyltransferase
MFSLAMVSRLLVDPRADRTLFIPYSAPEGHAMVRRAPARRPRRAWGQHFLVNTGACETIVSTFRPRPDDRVLEIGPGRGALTRRLVGRVGRLLAIEVDPDLVSELRRELGQGPDPGRLDLVEGDVLEADLDGLLTRLGADAGHPGRVIANLPYNIATAVILRLLGMHGRLRDLLLMVQREVADRMTSPPGRKSYGSLTVLCQAFARVEPILTLGPGSFSPPPKVDSAVVRLTLQDPGGAAGRDRAAFMALVRTAFEQRRKTLLNNLARLPKGAASTAGAPFLGRLAAERLIRAADLDPGHRAEAIPVGGFLVLAERLDVAGGGGRYNPPGDQALPE